jgi:hypothetical protein
MLWEQEPSHIVISLQLISETIDGGTGGLYSKTITRSYEGTGETMVGRYKGINIAADGYSVSYSYDTYGRFSSLRCPSANGEDVFTYNYLANSNLVASIDYPHEIKVENDYEENRDLITQVKNSVGSVPSVVSQYDYNNDQLGRRTSVDKSGTAFSASDTITYGYNTRSEVTSATATNDSTYNYGYNFDAIGNRKDYTTNETGSPVKSDYTTNNLNQYTSITNPAQSPTYDDDGSLIADGNFTYEWNGENRLISLTSTKDPSDLDYVKLEFKYDYMGRRVSKKVWKWEGSGVEIPPEVQERIDRLIARRDRRIELITTRSNIYINWLQQRIENTGNPRRKRRLERLLARYKRFIDRLIEEINDFVDRRIARIYEQAGIDPNQPQGDPEWGLARGPEVCV